MLKKPKNKEKTVAEKIADTLLHPNESGSDSESEEEATAARVIDYDDNEYELPEAATTEFRKRNVKLLADQSAKYKGKIASRKDFENSSDEANSDNEEEEEEEEEEDYENSDSSDDENALKSFNKVLKKNNKTEYEDSDASQQDDINEEGMDEEEQSSDDDEDDDDDDMEDDNDSDDEHDDDDDTEVVSKVNHEAEIQKGLSVQNQLRLWERLLELRISLQKIVNKTNQLPAPQEINDLNVSNAKYKDIQQVTCKQTCQLLQNLLSLQNTLFTQYPELDKAMKPCLKRPFPFKDNNQNEPPLKQFSEYMQESFNSFSSYRNSVLLKWDDRTKLLQPGAGNKKRTLTEEYDIIKKIDNALMNKTVLKAKSQQLKTSSTKDNENGDDVVRNPNIYDDSDFYHQQLRELIEYKANTSTSMSEVTKQFVELQKLRQKMKKKVDTRASKGRKLRYIVHNKLINFMAPHDNYTWTMDSIDELSKSLFV